MHNFPYIIYLTSWRGCVPFSLSLYLSLSTNLFNYKTFSRVYIISESYMLDRKRFINKLKKKIKFFKIPACHYTLPSPPCKSILVFVFFLTLVTKEDFIYIYSERKEKSICNTHHLSPPYVSWLNTGCRLLHFSFMSISSVGIFL